MKVKLILEYPYEGEEETKEAIVATEREAWINGDVSVEDVIASGTHTIEVVAIPE